MKNLIELFNKHIEENTGQKYYLNERDVKDKLDSLLILRYFIKWLVDNDKIDTGGKITEDLTYEYFQIPRKYFRGGKYARLSEEMNDIFYHRILACLSIQDNPIEFLISILK